MRERQLGALVHTDALPAPVVLAAAFACGSIPFSNIGARLTRGVDLREVGTGTVSGTSLHEVAGFGPLAVFGVLEVAKGAVGPLLARGDRPILASAAGAAAVAGHNWSPFLRGAGGRGISPATGALLANAPAGAAVLLGGMALGRLAHQTGLGSFLADIALVPVARRVHGRRGALAAAAVVTVIFAKRIAGNAPLPSENRGTALRNRLLFDRDD
jgi:glycerol-3-phosphate acyltransferase PlsY